VLTPVGNVRCETREKGKREIVGNKLYKLVKSRRGKRQRKSDK
jgi:hypothetical protein